MEQCPPNPSYAVPPPFSPPSSSHRSSTDLPKPNAMDIDTVRGGDDRSTRAASVLSGMSMEDMEAAETLNSLQHKYSSPQQNQQVPLHVHTQTTYNQDESQPILTLFTSQYPLAGSLLNGSLYAYKTTQSFIPGAQWTERNVGLPIAGTVARISGVEGGLRWYLQPKKDGKEGPSRTAQTPDVEKGQALEIESLPAYDEGGRSPPYSEQQVARQSSQRQAPPGWRQQLMISTSGLSIAMSEESLRSLRFCLQWLRWANGRLGEAIQSLKFLLDRYGSDDHPHHHQSPLQDERERQQAVMTARIATLRKDVLETIKQVVNIVSQYAGGALPENARNLVHRHLTSLPQRFSIANATHAADDSSDNEAEKSAGKVMLLAQEGLDMMTQVSRVVNDTLVSAEGWCEKLGRRTGREQQQQTAGSAEKGGDQPEERSETVRSNTVDGDVKMEM